MHRINGEDAGFIYMEQPEQPMNSMAVGVLEPGEPLTLDDVRRHLARRLDELPSFRWRIVPVPLRLHHPVAVRDPQFDLDRHLRHVTIASRDGVAGAATDADLDELFASIAEQHLDRERALWEVTLVDGLQDGRQALIVKYHHCLADGVAGIFNFSRLFSDAPFEPLPEPLSGAAPFVAERIPGRVRLVRDAMRDHLRGLLGLASLLVRTIRGVRAMRSRRRSSTIVVPGFDAKAPWTPLNDAFTARRSYVRAQVPLAGVKQIKDASGGTLNDVLLAVMAGALCHYLPTRGGLPERPLLTTVPVSTEETHAPMRQSGNHFWSFTTTLATDVDDPWERLAVIGACAREGKQRLELLGVGLVPDWLDILPPLVVEPGARAMLERGRSATDSVDANILISNVRGPAEPWSLGGRVVQDLYVDGPPSNGVGVNVMVWSYGDRLLLGCLAFADSLDDPAGFRTAIQASYEELLALSARSAA